MIFAMEQGGDMSDKIYCRECKFFQKRDVDENGYCHFNPPTEHTTSDKYGNTSSCSVHPFVMRDGWCGKGKLYTT